MIRVLSLVVVVVVVVVAGGCAVDAPGPFGARCASAADCGGLQCRVVDDVAGARCVPPRARGEAGESCENAVVVGNGAKDGVLVDEVDFFGDAGDDLDVCGVEGRGDVALRFTLPEARGLTLHVDDPDVVVGLFAVDDDGCGADVRFGCGAKDDDAVVPAAAAGDYVVVVDGAPEDAGAVDERGVHVVVETIDCPLGGLPFDAGHCLLWTPVQHLLRARAGAGADVFDGGDQVVFVGGVGKDGEAKSDGEQLDLKSGAISFVDIIDRRARPLVKTVSEIGSSPQVFVLSDDDNDSVEVVSFDELTVLTVPGDTPTEIYDVLSVGDVSAALTDFGITRMRVVREACDDANPCSLTQDCVAGVCACAIADCREPIVPQLEHSRDGAFDPGARGQGAGDVAVVSSGVVGEGYRLFVLRNDRLIERRPIAARERDGAGLVGDDRFVWSFGGRYADDGSAADVIERVDVIDEAVEVVGHLPRPIAEPQVAAVGDLVVIVDGAAVTDEAVVFDRGRGEFVRAPPLPVALRDRAMVGVNGGVVVAGGIDGAGAVVDDVFGFSVVARNATVVPPPAVCTAGVLPSDGSSVDGSTAGLADRFRDPVCFFSGIVGDEQWQFTLDEPSSVRIVTASRDQLSSPLNLTVTDGLCTEDAVVAGCDQNSLYIGRLEAGTWYVSVEASLNFVNPGEEAIEGRSYTIGVVTAAPDACPLDAFDPADDVVTGARPFVRSVDDPLVGVTYDAGGLLCPGDVDHLLLEYNASEDFPFFAVTVGAPDGSVSVAPAIVDVAASTHDHLVTSGVVGDFVPLEEWASEPQPPGYYVLRVGPLDVVGGIAWNANWDPGCYPDEQDALFREFDDITLVENAPRLAPGDILDLAACVVGDRDVVVFEPEATRPSIITVEPGSAEPLLVDFSGGVVGDALDVEFSDFDPEQPFIPIVARVPPRAAPFALVIARDDDSFDEVAIGFDQPPAGDACEDPLPLGASGTTHVDSFDFRDDLNAIDIGNCTNFRSPGEDVVFAVEVGAAETLTATVTPTGDFDVAVYLLSSCPLGDFADVCEVGADVGNSSEADGIVFVNDGAAAEFFLVVDSFNGASYSADLTWRIE